jgi:hypothetical protein
LVGSSEAEKVPGLVRFLSDIFYRVFELPSPPKNAQTTGFVCRFVFKTFFVLFLNSSRWELPENAIKQNKVEEKLTSNTLSVFSGKVFDI